MDHITSAQNPKIKQIVKLRKVKTRKEKDLIIIEGRKEIEMALMGKIDLKELYFCPNLAGQNIFIKKIPETAQVDEKIFKKISYRENPDGYLALAHHRYVKLEELNLDGNPLILILEAIEKPGNLGAILRTADAAGISAVVINDPKVDLYNPNVIRSSRGAIFTVTTAFASKEKTADWLQANKIKSFAACLDAEKNYTDFNYQNSAAIIFGTEDKGLSSFWLAHADEKIKIPMRGKIDSLNVSVSAAVIIFEIIRQKNLI